MSGARVAAEAARPSMPPDEARLLRDAFGAFPTGVAVVTTRDGEGCALGATISSFSPVSIDPPLVLFSIARSARAFETWARVDAFAINVLEEGQRDVSTQFARSLSDKWNGLDPLLSEVAGLPLLRDTLAWFECRTWARYDGGDHLILVGEIIAFSNGARDDARPLVFYGSRYARLEARGDL